MNQIIRILETTSIDELNRLLASSDFRLYEHTVNNGIVTYYVAELRTLSDPALEDAPAGVSGQPIPVGNAPSQCDAPARRSQQSNPQ